MPDSRQTDKPRQIRGKVCAGLPDIEEFQAFLAEFSDDLGFSLTFEDLRRRGDHGPLFDYTWGLTEDPTKTPNRGPIS
jgi:hypothetical protein